MISGQSQIRGGVEKEMWDLLVLKDTLDLILRQASLAHPFGHQFERDVPSLLHTGLLAGLVAVGIAVLDTLKDVDLGGHGFVYLFSGLRVHGRELGGVEQALENLFQHLVRPSPEAGDVLEGEGELLQDGAVALRVVCPEVHPPELEEDEVEGVGHDLPAAALPKFVSAHEPVLEDGAGVVPQGEVEDADHIDGLEPVAEGLLSGLTANPSAQRVLDAAEARDKLLADGVGGVEEHPVEEVGLALVLHLDHHPFSRSGADVHVKNTLFFVKSKAVLLFVDEGDFPGVDFRDEQVEQHDEEVFVFGGGEDDLEDIVVQELGVAPGGG